MVEAEIKRETMLTREQQAQFVERALQRALRESVTFAATAPLAVGVTLAALGLSFAAWCAAALLLVADILRIGVTRSELRRVQRGRASHVTQELTAAERHEVQN